MQKKYIKDKIHIANKMYIVILFITYLFLKANFKPIMNKIIQGIKINNPNNTIENTLIELTTSKISKLKKLFISYIVVPLIVNSEEVAFVIAESIPANNKTIKDVIIPPMNE